MSQGSRRQLTAPATPQQAAPPATARTTAASKSMAPRTASPRETPVRTEQKTTGQNDCQTLHRSQVPGTQQTAGSQKLAPQTGSTRIGVWEKV